MDRIRSEQFKTLVRESGVDPEILDLFGSFSTEASEVYSASDRVARYSLSCEFSRLQGTMEYLAWLADQLPPIHHAADLGGGVGMLSFYLASISPIRQMTVYDHGNRSLELGRTWAQRWGFSNVLFELESYGSIAKKSCLSQNDLVICSHGLPMALPHPATGSKAFDVTDCQQSVPMPTSATCDLIVAISNLLSQSGVAVLTFNTSGWGLVNLLEACRMHGLGIDWRLSEFNSTTNEAKYRAFHLVVRKGIPNLTCSSFEDAVSFLKLRNAPEMERRSIGKPSRESECSTRNKHFLIEGEGTDARGRPASLSLGIDDGCLTLINVDGDGSQSQYRGNLGHLGELLEMVQSTISAWQEGDRTLKQWCLNDYLKKYLDFCSEHALR